MLYLYLGTDRKKARDAMSAAIKKAAVLRTRAYHRRAFSCGP